MSDLESLRGEVREWLEENCPPSMRQPMDIAQAANWGGRKREFYEDAEDGESWMRAMASSPSLEASRMTRGGPSSWAFSAGCCALTRSA